MSRVHVLAALVACLALPLLPAVAAKGLTYTIHAGTHDDGSMYFTPNTFTVAKEDRVTITVINNDTHPNGTVKTPHDLAILDLGEEEEDENEEHGECPAAAGNEYQGKKVAFEVCLEKEVTRTFEAGEKAGTFRFICEVPGHEAAGMKGTFTVKSGGLPAPGAAAFLAALLGCILFVARRRR
jgi:uncharacterized cupredoxin-like copper-binding protein